MNTGAQIALFAISSLSLVASGATLVVVLVGAKKIETQVEETKVKTNEKLKKFKDAIQDLEL